MLFAHYSLQYRNYITLVLAGGSYECGDNLSKKIVVPAFVTVFTYEYEPLSTKSSLLLFLINTES